MKKWIVFITGILIASGIGYSYLSPKTAPESATTKKAVAKAAETLSENNHAKVHAGQQQALIMPTKTTKIRRCPKGGKKKGHPMRLIINGQLVWEKPAKEVLQMPGTFTMNIGRHRGDQALPLTALLGQQNFHHMAEITPCSGPALRFVPGELQGLGAKGISIVISPRGILKLMDMRHADGRIALKNIHMFHLFDMSFPHTGDHK